MSEESIVTELAENGEDSLGTVNQTPFINRAKVKAFALEFANQTRAQKFSRVGMSFLTRIDSKVRQAIISEVRGHPSKGKTLL